MRFFFLVFLILCPVQGQCVWRDSDFYYKTGSRFQLDAGEQQVLINVARSRLEAEFSAHYIVDGSTEPSTSFLLPYSNDFANDYGIYSGTTTSQYYDWGSGGLLYETSNIVNEYSDAKDQTIGYGRTDYACQILTWDYEQMNCTTAGDGHHDVATMGVEDMVGYKTRTGWIKCNDEWVVKVRYYYGCYLPSNLYPTYAASSGTVGGYASPAQYADIQALRTLLETAIATATASGMTGRGVDVNQFVTILQYLNEGYPVASTGTVSGTGDVGTTSGSSTTINVNVEFPDYLMNAPATGEWDVWAATSADSSIITNLIDARIEQASATVGGLRAFLDQFQIDDSVYDPCISSACFSMMGHELGCLQPQQHPLYESWRQKAVWVLRALCAAAALAIILM